MQLHRKVLQPAFSKAQVRQYQDNQERQALICLRNMLDDQANYIRAIRRFAVAIVLGISYGIDVESPDSPWIKIADDAAEAISNSGAPASSIIDHFPASMFNFPSIHHYISDYIDSPSPSYLASIYGASPVRS